MTVNEEEQSQNRPSLRKYTLPRLRSWLHVSQVVFTLLSVCMVAPIVAVQLAYKGSSAPGPNYTLFVIAFTVLIPACLAFFPWMYESKNRMKRCGKFFLKPRTNVVFTSFCSLLWLTAGIAITTYALAPDTCTLDSNQKADGYSSAWTAQCNCAKVAIAFVWLTSLLWIITLLMALLVFYKQKQLVQQNLQHVAQTKEQGTVEVVVAPDPTPTVDPAVVEPYHEQQPTPPAVVEPYYEQQPVSPAVVEPYYEQQSAQQHYSFLPQHYYAANPQPSPPYLHPPLATMPDPQHYRQQHGVV